MSSIPAVTLPPLKAHKGTVIFLHGLGDSGHGWEDGMQFVQQINPHIKFICPHAPNRRVTINFGAAMPAWYDITSLDGKGTDDVKGLEESEKTIQDIIAQEIKQGVPHERIIVGGFSQGAVVSMFSVYQYPQKLAGCISLSGYLALADKFAERIKPVNKDTPLLMFHGDADQVINVNFGRRSHEALEKMGINAKLTVIPRMPHTATEQELMDVAKWIKERIPDN
jgi:predicted esterase